MIKHAGLDFLSLRALVHPACSDYNIMVFLELHIEFLTIHVRPYDEVRILDKKPSYYVAVSPVSDSIMRVTYGFPLLGRCLIAHKQ